MLCCAVLCCAVLCCVHMWHSDIRYLDSTERMKTLRTEHFSILGVSISLCNQCMHHAASLMSATSLPDKNQRESTTNQDGNSKPSSGSLFTKGSNLHRFQTSNPISQHKLDRPVFRGVEPRHGLLLCFHAGLRNWLQ